MKIKAIQIFFISILSWIINSAVLAQPSALNGTSPLVGTWLTDVKSHLTIRQCDVGLCGYITKVAIRPELYNKHKKEIDAVGIQNAYDYFNKDPELRSRRLLGLQILTLDKMQAPNIYSGEIYNPEDGKTYKGRLELINNDQLRLTGCAFYGLFCSSQDWFRINNKK